MFLYHTARRTPRASNTISGTTPLSPATLSRFSLLHVFVQLQNWMEENSVCEYRIMVFNERLTTDLYIYTHGGRSLPASVRQAVIIQICSLWPS